MKFSLHFLRKTTALLIAASLIATGPAAATDIADVPMAVKNTVHPNIMFTLDDSGSMHWEVMPEGMIVNDVYHMFPINQDRYGNALTDFYDDGGTGRVGGYEDLNEYNFVRRSVQNNKIYYNPDIDYKPWSNADGSLWANADPTCAYHNPALTGRGCRNLTVQNDGAANTSTDSYGKWRRRNSAGTYAWYTGVYVNAVTAESGFWPATYFNWNTANAGCGSTTTDRDCYSKVEIRTTTTSYTSPGGIVRTYAQEIQNFANWYTYYRSRILTARAGVGAAFSRQGNAMRVGFGAINKGLNTIDGVSTRTLITGVRKFEGTARTNYFTQLYGHVIPTAGTPLRRAMDDVGKYFTRDDNTGPWADTPGTGGATPHKACRQNYHILMTDGYWNGDAASTPANANNDGTDGTAIPNHTPYTPPNPPPPTFTYSAVNPYTDSYSDTLADVAAYYWKTDLRTGLDNKVPTNSKDPAYWQHMVNFTVGLGVTGTVSSASIASAFTSTPATITWPDPTASDVNKIDDLAHAAINSRGGFFSASDPTTFANALADALQDISSRNSAAAAVAVANANLVAGDSVLYASGYNSGDWSGQLSAYALDPLTAIPATTTTWTSQSQLDALAHGSRKIASYTGITGTGQGIQFQPTSASTTTKLSAAQQTLLNTPTLTDGASVVAWLRGDRTNEGSSYRTRTHVLGDIINTEPVIVREPRANYVDSGYAVFKSSYASRAKVVFQGANDGMLHAFKADNGSELWAYVPNLLMPTLNLLSLKTGFAHHYYIDGTPTVGDADFNNTASASGSPDWHTMLVSGLGKGGRGYFALNVTDPTATDEAAAAAKVLWEFPNSATSATDKNNMGYSFGRPIIVKTRAKGWVVLVTSGYNNGTDSSGDGVGYLFVLDARSGDVIQALSTGVGSAADPSGLAQISAYVENGDIDNTTDFVYGGDLKGNLWRFDLSGSTTATWNVKKIATLVDDGSNYQPITTVPELAKIKIGSSYKRLVYVGTGLYLGDTDVPGTTGANAHATQTQTMYALVDDLSTAPTISPLRSNLQPQEVFTTGVFTITPVDYSTKKGWYLNLPTPGERSNTDPVIGLTTLAFTTNVPNSDPCIPGGSSYFYAMDYAYETGRSTPFVTATRISLGSALASRPVLVKTDSGLKAIIRLSDQTTPIKDVPLASSGTTTKRISWRELPEQ